MLYNLIYIILINIQLLKNRANLIYWLLRNKKAKKNYDINPHKNNIVFP